MIRARGGSAVGLALVAAYIAVLVGVAGQLGIWEGLGDDPRPADHARPDGEGDDSPRRITRAVRATAASTWRTLRPAALAIVVAAASSVGARTAARRRRISRISRWEIRLGREDVATPYQREKLFDAFYGQLVVRWWARLAVGQPSVALEVHQGRRGTQHLTLAAGAREAHVLEGRLLATYPDVRVLPVRGTPSTGVVIRLKKRHPFVERIQTVKDDEQALMESVVSTMASAGEPATVQIVLTPAPWPVHLLARRLLKQRERQLTRAERGDPTKSDIGIDSVVEEKELKGALETQHRSLFFCEIRVGCRSRKAARALAGVFAETRSENALVIREPRLRAALFRRRTMLAAANPLPSWRRGVLSSSELAALWSLPRQRARVAQLVRSSVRRAPAPPEIARAPEREIMREERGPVGLYPADLKYGVAFIGGQGVGKTSAMARTIAIDARDRDACLIVLDPKHDLAEHALSLLPEDRTVWYMDLARPEVGVNPLAIDASPSAVADVVLQAMKEAHEPGAILSQSDEFLRNAALAVCAVERQPTLWHMYELLSPRRQPYRLEIVSRLNRLSGMDAVARYWGTTFPERWMDSRTHMAGQLAAPLNKINRLLTTPSIDVALRHPFALDLARVIRDREILVVNGALGEVGEENAIVVLQMLLQLIHQAMKQQQRLPSADRVRVCLKIDEAHLLLTPSFATMLALHRAAGPLEVTASWQYSAQIEDRAIRSGLKSLLRSRSMFSMGEVSDAREQAEVAMEVYSDLIRSEREDRDRMRFGPDDIVRLPTFVAINSWVAHGARQTAFVARTHRIEGSGEESRREHHLERQREAGACWPELLPAPMETRPDPTPTMSNGGQAPARVEDADAERPVDATSRVEAYATAKPAADDTAAPSNTAPAEPPPPAVAATYLAVHRSGVLGLRWDPVAPKEGAAEALEFRPRDGEILRALWRYELFLVSQIWQEWWPGKSLRSAQIRLKQLADAGLVQRFRPRVSGHHEAGYALTRDGFLAGKRHAGADGPFIPDDAKWKERSPVDHGAVQHLLQVNAWVLVFRRTVGGHAVDWRGEHEGRLEVPTRLDGGRRVPIGVEDVRLDHYLHVSDLQAADFGRVWPDATTTLTSPAGAEADLMVELDRTNRPSRNFHKFLHYDALITAWWRKIPRYRQLGEPPVAVFVCTDEAHAFGFMEAADRQVTGRVADPSAPEASWPYPGRERIFFVAERDIHEGSLRAWRLPEPPEVTGRLLHSPREVQLPGAVGHTREASAVRPII